MKTFPILLITKVSRCWLLAVLLFPLWCPAQLVSVNKKGNLVYEKYANQGQDNAVNTVPDFSMAGYRGGGVAIPTVAVKTTVNPARGDDADRIQAAIDRVSALPLDENGFRGAVLLKKGAYQVAGTLNITTSGVVLRGEGPAEGGTKIIATGERSQEKCPDLIVVSGSGHYQEVKGSSQAITTHYVPVGSRTLTIASTQGYRVGDEIVVERTPNRRWLKDMDDMTQWGWTTKAYTVGYERKITKIKGNTLTLDAPIVQVIEDQYGGGRVYRYSFPGRIARVGVENLKLVSEYASDEDENHAWEAVVLRGVEHGWVRKVTAQYFAYSCVAVRGVPDAGSTQANSRFITIEDCAMLDPKSRIAGGRRYSFVIGGKGGQFILFQRCYTRGGRHDYVVQSRVAGPNVFLDCYASQTHSDIGPHHRYATGTLFDNILGGEMRVRDRMGSGSEPGSGRGHGWAGAQTMFWNCESRSSISSRDAHFHVSSPPGGRNWGVGVVIGEKKEGNGYWESVDKPVAPRSLYLEQLEARLGSQAVERVTIPAQRTGRIWKQLAAWAGGEGVSFSDFPNPNEWYRISSQKRPNHALHDANRAFEDATTMHHVITFPYKGYPAQKWRFVSTDDGYYRISSQRRPDRSLHDSRKPHGDDRDAFYAFTFLSRDYDSQKWRILNAGDGYYRLVSQNHPTRGLHDSNQAYQNSDRAYYVLGLPYQDHYEGQRWRLEAVGSVNARAAATDKADQETPVAEHNPGEFAVYPNPVQDYLRIRLPEGQPREEIRLAVYTLSGQKVLSERITAEAISRLDVSTLKTGTYILHWVGPREVVQFKFVKE